MIGEKLSRSELKFFISIIIDLGVFVCIAHGVYVNVIKYAGAIFASFGTYVVTVSGVFWGVLLLGETHPAWIWLFLVTMMMAVYMVKPKRLRTAKSQTEKTSAIEVKFEVNQPAE